MSDVPEIIIDQVNGPKLILSNSSGELKEVKFNDDGSVGIGTTTVLLSGEVSAFPDITAVYNNDETQSVGSIVTRLVIEEELEAGDYEAILSFNWRLNNTKPDFVASLELDESNTIWEMQERPRASGSTQKLPVSAIAPFTISSTGTHKLEFKYYCTDKKKIAYVSKSYMKIKRVK